MKKATEWNSYHVVKERTSELRYGSIIVRKPEKVSGHEATIEHQYGKNDTAIDD